MPKLFDTQTGEVFVGEHLVLRKNLTRQAVVNMGFVFYREFNMKTGWVHSATGPHLMAGRLANLALGFKDENLESVSFAFADKSITNVEDLHKLQDQVLIQELGVPDRKNEGYITYDFQWGGISSGLDPRGGSCDITIRWR
ncbi:hypothetical protein ABK905_05495 [Acerihabitans sp. KWT182]|uniref:Uncharacterized protein n=1 Tax=Acerihabitans sp. KWT182 TaxID=3157919 RepID=A0AAU7QC60_9GAMM